MSGTASSLWGDWSSEDRQLLLAAFAPSRPAQAAASRLFSLYPDTGPLRRELYVKHLEFFRLGARYTQRLMLAANRVGKTEGIGGYETTLHLTGLYPHWWEGRRFDRPVKVWVAGNTAVTTRDIVQAKLFGRPVRVGGRKGVAGDGLVPRHLVESVTWKPGIRDCLDTVMVRHASGGASMLQFRSYEQGRIAFEGTEQDVIWLDEEPSVDVFSECIVRTMTTDGIVMLTFTPLKGMTELVMMFLNAQPELKVVEDE